MQDYLTFWGVEQAVFARPVPADQPFAPPRIAAQLERLALACEQAQPLVVVTGEPGSGKSTVLRWLFRRLDPIACDVLLIAMVRKEREAGWLAPRLAELMGIAPGTPPLPTADLIRAVARRLDELVAEDRRLVVAVDAAHCAETPAAFDELIALLNLQALAGGDAARCLAFVLCGADPLLDTLNDTPELATRLAYHAQLSRLTREETGGYMAYRLRAAGIAGPVFDDDALDFVHMKARGVFAALDTCADACLVEAYQRGVRRVTLDVAQAATGYLGQRDLAPAQRRPPRSLKVAGDAAELPDADAPPPERPIKLADLTRRESPVKIPPAPPAEPPAATPASAGEESASIKLSSLFKSDGGNGRGRS